jgi:lipoprotein-anchoring transpeptidase ErfK/SrfK
MRSLFGSLVILFLLLPLGPVRAQQSAKPVKVSMSLARAATSSEQSVAPEARETPDPSALAAAVAREVSLPPPPPPITLVLKADLRRQRLTVVEGGEVKYVWPISSGRAGYATQTGTFRPKWASRMHYSKQYDMAPMPYAVFFNRGAAFHATQAVRYLGRPASHGCIRLSPRNARRLFRLVHRHGFRRTKVVVHGTHTSTRMVRGHTAKPRRNARRSRYPHYSDGGGVRWRDGKPLFF